MLHLRIELWERVLIGDEIKLGKFVHYFSSLLLIFKIASGVVSLKSTSDVLPLQFNTTLWQHNEFACELSGEVALKFQDLVDLDAGTSPVPSSDTSINTSTADLNRALSPPMSVSFFKGPIRTIAKNYLIKQIPQTSTMLPFPINTETADTPSSIGSTSSTSSSPFGGTFFSKLQQNLNAPTRNFFSKPQPTANISSHR